MGWGDSVRLIFHEILFKILLLDLLPGPPQDLSVSAENETSIRVSWSLPSTDPQLTKQFVLNVTYIQ